MVCEDTALTCAVKELNETLQGGPTGFEIWAQLVVPGLGVVATVVVAVASLALARQAHRFTVAARAEEERVRRLGVRHDIAGIARDWLLDEQLARLQDDSSRRESAIVHLLELDGRLEVSDEPYAEEFRLEMRGLLRTLPKVVPQDGPQILAAAVAAARLSIREWVLRPDFWGATQDIRSRAYEESLKKIASESDQ